MLQGTAAIKDLIETKKLGDKLPFVGWFHFPLADPYPDEFFAETTQTAQDYDWDLIKIMTCGNYIPVAYGADYEFSTNPQKWDGVFYSHPITCAADAAALEALTAENKTLADEVVIDGRIVDHYAGSRPVLATLFDPLSWVQELSTPMQPEFTIELMRSDPKALRHALDALQQTNRAFLDALIKVGIDGIFLASKFSTGALITPEEHREYVVPYLKDTAQQLKEGGCWFSMLHVHGDRDLYFDDLLDLDYQAFNWESVGSAPRMTSIADLREKTDKILIAGIDHNRDFEGTREQVIERLRVRLFDALDQNKGGAFIFGPGCTLPLTVDRSLFSGIREVVEEAGLR